MITYCNVAPLSGEDAHPTTKLVDAVLVVTPHTAPASAFAPKLTDMTELDATEAASAVMVKEVAAPSGTHPEVSSAKLPLNTPVMFEPPLPIFSPFVIVPPAFKRYE